VNFLLDKGEAACRVASANSVFCRAGDTVVSGSNVFAIGVLVRVGMLMFFPPFFVRMAVNRWWVANLGCLLIVVVMLRSARSGLSIVVQRLRGLLLVSAAPYRGYEGSGSCGE
jgi:hypothetical protein